MATTFESFPLLPFELRALIWRSTIHPRTVEINVCHDWKYPELFQPSSPPPIAATDELGFKQQIEVLTLQTTTPVPPVLQACRESRLELIRSGYAKGCSELIPPDQFQGDVPPPPDQRRHVWINWEIDTLDIGGGGGGGHSYEFGDYAPIGPLVRSLKFERENEWYHRSEAGGLVVFENVQRIYVVCEGGFRSWRPATDQYWPCGVEDVVMIDEHWIPWNPEEEYDGPGERVEMGLLEMIEMLDRQDENEARYLRELTLQKEAALQWPEEEMEAVSDLLEWLHVDS
ncbi:hypothetical protein QBC41DRAFT_249747 [Cercophora samala]|uniref:2EXR domain-containing protein n=1 Tax=Cercophora samala TaxID=330535 RepID=A0AA40DAJ1_9PEZI|nr:hypothetical protein QBC41DRAFT_249747 [Cercophora samala]